jgi:phenylalanyl-tRNA synthetase alpha chain
MQAPGVVATGQMKKALKVLKDKALKGVQTIKALDELQALKAHYLGKKGELKEILSSLASLEPEERVLVGKIANEVRDALTLALEEKSLHLKDESQTKSLGVAVDTSAPGRLRARGTFHPLSETSRDIFGVLEKLGFARATGPEIEHDFYNFEALNIPKTHPARDMQDTFYVDEDVILRTHTSPVQIRAMLAKKTPPLRIMSFGRVYRRDEDITHSPMFHQIEGLYIDTKVSLGDLKATLTAFAQGIFSKDANIRMRPSYFPFTEPSMEVDVSCFACHEANAKDCRLCKATGWIEILGAGMVDPAVFEACGYDPEKYCGFAFGMGVERIAMLRYAIPDIRLFFENDLRFLRQF